MDSLSAVRSQLQSFGSVITGFSGGADSALLAWLAHDELGSENALAVTAVSASLAPEEKDDCAALADEWNLNWQTVVTNEMNNPNYEANDGLRCYYCKAELIDTLDPIAKARNATVILGVNVDDLGDYRPGQKAAQERGARFPLVEAGLTKPEVREISRNLGLRTWDKPAAACLSSRVPYGTPVTFQTLDQVAKAETMLKQLGFRELRVRHYGDTARIEFGPYDLEKSFELREEIIEGVKKAGYLYVTIDLEGLRSGNLNQALRRGAVAPG